MKRYDGNPSGHIHMDNRYLNFSKVNERHRKTCLGLSEETDSHTTPFRVFKGTHWKRNKPPRKDERKGARQTWNLQVSVFFFALSRCCVAAVTQVCLLYPLLFPESPALKYSQHRAPLEPCL
jgi:hypothetical protein